MKFEQVYQGGLKGRMRSQPEDFIVDEIARVIPSGNGEHVWLKIQKTSSNTDWLAGLLARIAGVKKRDIGFAGLKDRHAVTTQWFSIYLPGQDAPDWESSLPPEVQILEETRHDRKLRRGTLKGNHFIIILRDCSYDKKYDNKELESLVAQIRTQGIPNYFGEQRFGRNFNNIEKAKQWFRGDFRLKDRNKRSMYLSAARSLLFNQILSTRIKQGNWNKAIEGDVFMLEGSHSCFSDDGDSTIKQRIENLELHPTAALWGQGEVQSTKAMQEIELAIAQVEPLICKGLESNKLKQERRSMRVPVNDLACEVIDDTTVRFEFSLPPGAYATVLMNQLGLDIFSCIPH